MIGRMLRRVEVARDRIASDYLPSPANAPRQRRELGLTTLRASEAAAARCTAIARQARDGKPLPPALLDEGRQTVRQLDDEGLAVS